MNKQYLSQSESTYKELQSFESVELMNAAINEHKQAHDLTNTERQILDAISRYACKYEGVCYLSKQKIAEEAGFKSRRTAIRACLRLEKLGIIKQYETRRIKGDRRQSSNIIVIKPVTAESHAQEAPSKTIKSSNTYKDTEPREEKLSVDTIIKRGLRHAIPKSVYDALSPFFGGQELYDVYGILLRAKSAINRDIRIEDHASDFMDAFYNVVRLFKADKVRSLYGLLYTTWERLSARIDRDLKPSNSGLTGLFREYIGSTSS